jgi:hypothetical protein
MPKTKQTEPMTVDQFREALDTMAVHQCLDVPSDQFSGTLKGAVSARNSTGAPRRFYGTRTIPLPSGSVVRVRREM